jgi:hypothetical protein
MVPIPKGLELNWSVETLDKLYAHWLRYETSLLSPYPKSYEENLRWRLEILRKAEEDVAFRERVRALFFEDILFAFNAFYYTKDVRQRPRHDQPFCTYWYQDLSILTTLRHITEGRDLAKEKSRDMGASWDVIGTIVWLWLSPKGGGDFLFGSRIEDYVDKKGDMRTLFEKARYLIRRLPWWLLPKGWSGKCDNFMKLVNPETGSSITGESNNPNFSTGGRYLAALLDEFGKWEGTSESAWTATADATPCRIPVSTPFGAHGQYFTVVTDGKTDKITMHWSLHPKKAEGLYCVFPKPKELVEKQDKGIFEEVNWLNWKGEEAWLRSPWYDAECKRRGSTEIAQELDIDYIGAGRPAFDGRAGRRVLGLLRSDRRPIGAFRFDDDGSMHRTEFEGLESYEGFLVVYDEPTRTSEEVVSVDVVEGKEHGDYAVIKGLNRSTKSCSFSYFSRIDEANLAGIIISIEAWLTKDKASCELEPTIAIETNSPGLATFDICVERGMTNLFLMPNFDSLAQKVVHTKGWRTTGSSRKKVVSALKAWLSEGVGWVDQRCAGEMTSFVYVTPNKPQAAAGRNDDEVMAWGIALAVDELLPGGEYVPPQEMRRDGLPANIFNIEDYKREHEPTIEERCFETALRKRRYGYAEEIA